MQTLKRAYVALFVLSFSVFWGCQKPLDVTHTDENNHTVAGIQQANNTCNPNAYVITLESITQVNNLWEWVWSVRNPNPGNGNNGTVQDLSHWGMQFASCFNATHISGAAYSSNGSVWYSFNPVIKTDPSQKCMTTPVLKFDFGTKAGNKSFYKLILSANYFPGNTSGYYKSGARTGCCTIEFTGVSCSTGSE